MDDERDGSLGVGGAEQGGHRPGLRGAVDDRALGAGGVHHRSNVVHPGLEGRRLIVREGVGETGSPAVEHDQPGERRQGHQEAGLFRLLPGDLDVGEPGREIHEIDRPVADHLVRDVHPVDSSGEMGFGDIHGRIVCSCPRVRNRGN